MATEAKEKQVGAIRTRMQEIRTQLPYHVDDARDEFREFMNWKTQVRRHPMLTFTIVSGLAYFLVPRKQKPKALPTRRGVHHFFGGKPHEEVKEDVKQTSFISGIMGSLLTLALRSGLNFAAREATSRLSQSFQKPSPKYTPEEPAFTRRPR